MGFKWGIVGCGNIADNNFIPALKMARGAVISAVTDTDGNRAKLLAEKHGLDKCFADFDTLIKDKDIDAVYIATPNKFHCEQVIKAAQNGKHILCEKPMAISAAECDAMLKACSKYGVKLMIGYMSRFQPAILEAKRLITTGAIGSTGVVCGYFSFIFPENLFHLWRMNKEVSGGGCMMDIGVYLLNTLRFMVGAKEISVISRSENGRGIACEIFSSSILTYENGVRGMIECNFKTALRSGFEIRGSTGSIFAEHVFERGTPAKLTLHKGEGHEKIQDFSFDEINPYQKEIEYFAECIKLDKEPEIGSGQEGLLDIKAINAIYKSSSYKQGKEIKIS